PLMRENVPGRGRGVGADSVAPRTRIGADHGTLPGHETGPSTRSERRNKAAGRSLSGPRSLSTSEPIRSKTWGGAIGTLPRRPSERSGLAFGCGHGRFACGTFMPVVQCCNSQLTPDRRVLAYLEVSCFHVATIQIP